MRYHHIIWDFDGTLFDTYPALNRAIRLAAADLGAIVQADRIARLLNQTLALCIETLVMDHGLEREMFSARIDHYHNAATPKDKPPMPGALETCRQVIEAGGHNYIFTHRGRTTLRELLDWYKAQELFVECLSVEDGFPRKPNPAGFAAIVEHHGLTPGDVLAVGDRRLDVLAAQKAGLATCLFAPEPDPLVTADYLIGNLDGLATVLEIA